MKAMVALENYVQQRGLAHSLIDLIKRAPAARPRNAVYLAFYMLCHMDSVFIFVRTYLGIDTGGPSQQGRPQASSRTRGISGSCRIIGSPRSSASHISRLGRARS
jgi:hypothetical protein